MRVCVRACVRARVLVCTRNSHVSFVRPCAVGWSFRRLFVSKYLLLVYADVSFCCFRSMGGGNHLIRNCFETNWPVPSPSSYTRNRLNFFTAPFMNLVCRKCFLADRTNRPARGRRSWLDSKRRSWLDSKRPHQIFSPDHRALICSLMSLPDTHKATVSPF